MTYRLTIRKDGLPTEKWWHDIVVFLKPEISGMGLDDIIDFIGRYLQENHRCRLCRDSRELSAWLEFETEADVALFLLRWA